MRNKNSLIINVVFILVFGLTTIWSTVPQLFWQQLLFVCLGFVLAYLFSRLDPRLLLSLSWPLYLLMIFLLLVTLVFARDIRGAGRWLIIGGFNFQASELAKPILSLFCADFVYRQNLRDMKNLLKYLLLTGVPIFLVKIQPDLGSALVLAFLAFIILFSSNIDKRWLVIPIALLLISIPLLPHVLQSYQLDRIESFIDPYHDPKGSGYNVIQSVIAVGSGGFLGKGVRLGTQSHLNFLPERHTDFIFASFAEEFGLLGITLALAAYFFLLRHLLNLANSLNKQNELYYLSISIFSIVFFQVVVNIGMNLGLMPVTGITLPFFSYGGSSMLSFFILLGLTLGLLEFVPKHQI